MPLARCHSWSHTVRAGAWGLFGVAVLIVSLGEKATFAAELQLLGGRDFRAMAGDGSSFLWSVQDIVRDPHSVSYQSSFSSARWKDGQYQGFGEWAPGGRRDSTALGLSLDGAVVVGEGNQTDTSGEAFRWTEETGMVGLGSLIPGGHSRAWAVSDDGSVVVGMSDSKHINNRRAFRWTEQGGMQDLGTIDGAGRSIAFAASADGSVVAGVSSSIRGYEAFRWTAEEGMVGLGALPGGARISAARDISADGMTIVGESESAHGESAVLWTAAEGLIDLGPGRATGVSGDGSIVVGNLTGEMAGPAIWTRADGWRLLSDVILAEDRFREAYGDAVFFTVDEISSDGLTIAGTGEFTAKGYSGDYRYYATWVLSVPEPPSILLLVVGALGCILMQGFSRMPARWRRNDSL